MRYCNECKCLQKVIDFHRDDPILACGHIKKPTKQRIYRLREYIDSRVKTIAPLLGINNNTLITNLINNLTSSDGMYYCHHCKRNVVHFIDDFGDVRCGGDLLIYAGCGKILEFRYQLILQ